MKIYLLCLVFFAAFVTTVNAQTKKPVAKPSVKKSTQTKEDAIKATSQETISWLQGKILKNWYSYDYSAFYGWNEAGVMTLEEVASIEEGVIRFTYKFHGKIGFLSPHKIDLYLSAVTGYNFFEVRGETYLVLTGRNLVLTKSNDYGSTQSGTDNKCIVKLYWENETDLINRMKKALKHLIALKMKANSNDPIH